MASVCPSTPSMVPRMRTGGGCCAHAVAMTVVTTASDAISEVSFGIGILGIGGPPGFLAVEKETPRPQRYSVVATGNAISSPPPPCHKAESHGVTSAG